MPSDTLKLTSTALLLTSYFTAVSTTVSAADENNNLTMTALEEIEIIGRQTQGLEILTKKLTSLPGTANDPLKAIESLPGIIMTPSPTGGPIAEPAIRGSSPKDNRYSTSGVEVGYVFHYDSLSIYNPQLIDSFQVLNGAWSAADSNATGGVIKTQLREPDGTGPSSIDLSLVRAGFLYEDAITDNSAFYLAFRESLIHTYVDNFIDDEEFSFKQPPRNRDYQGQIAWQVSDQQTLKLLATGAIDYLEISFDEDGRDVGKNPDLASGERYEQNYHNQALILDSDWSDTWQSTLSLNHLQLSENQREGDILNWQGDSQKITLRTDNQLSLSEGDLEVGGEWRQTTVDYSASGRRLPCNIEFEACPPSYFSPEFSDTGRLDIDSYQAYASFTGDISDSLSYTLGLNALGNQSSGASRDNENYIEPRARVDWQVNDNHRLALAYGDHHQWQEDYLYITPGWGNPDLEASRAQHLLLSWQAELGDGWNLRTEAYYKDMENLVVANPQAQVQAPDQVVSSDTPSFLNAANGKAYGVELLVSKALTDRWFGWASLAYSKTERTNELTDEQFNYMFDLPLVANLVLDYRFSDSWNAGLHWRFQSGRRYTDVVSASPYTEAGGEEPLFYVPEYGQFNEQQLKNYHRLDVRVDYLTQLGGLDSRIYFEVLNVYGSQAVQEFEYSEDYSSYELDYQFPDQPLPSIGIALTF